MTTVLVLGVGPLPHASRDKLHAPGLRVWSLAEQCRLAGFNVILACIGFGDSATAGKPRLPRPHSYAGISIYDLPSNLDSLPELLTQICEKNPLRAVVSNSDIMNAMSNRIVSPAPRWMDYNGDPFAEKQLQAQTYNHDGSLLPQWKLYFEGLSRGDQFSVCSQAQKYAVIGQLGFASRLDENSNSGDYIHVMPNSSRYMSGVQGEHFPVKGALIPASAKMLLWSGGFNTWSDPDCLAEGLKIVLRRNPTAYFVSTGGEIDGHDNKTFNRFKTQLGNEFHDRAIFLGWRPTSEIPSIYRQADVALNVDKWSVEGELGTRTRLVDWIQFEIPVVTTTTCEFAGELAGQELVTPYAAGQASDLARAIEATICNPEESRRRAARAAAYFDNYYRESTCYAPLRDWLMKEAKTTASAKSKLTNMQADWIYRK